VAVPETTLKPTLPLSLPRLGQLPDVDPPVEGPVPVTASPVSEVVASADGATARKTIVAKTEITAHPRPRRLKASKKREDM
jgi:hypothetical protein